MRWKKAKVLEDSDFKRLLGVKRLTFLEMVGVVKKNRAVSIHKCGGKKRGPKCKLNAYDKVLVMLMYYREYRTFAHIAVDYNLSESQCWRIVRDIEQMLIQSELFHLPGKKTTASTG